MNFITNSFDSRTHVYIFPLLPALRLSLNPCSNNKTCSIIKINAPVKQHFKRQAQRAINHANPISSNLRIFSVVMDDFSSPSQNFLYSARWVDTHRPRAVLALYFVGTWHCKFIRIHSYVRVDLKKKVHNEIAICKSVVFPLTFPCFFL